MLGTIGPVFGWVKLNLHLFNVATQKQNVNGAVPLEQPLLKRTVVRTRPEIRLVLTDHRQLVLL